MREKALVEWNADVPSLALFLREGLMLDACIYWLRHATRTAIWRYIGKSKARRTGKATPGLRCHVSTTLVNRSLGEPLGEPRSKMRPGGQGSGTQGWHRVGHVDLLQLHERHALLSLHLLALPLLTRQILYLSLREGLDGAQISCRLGLPRRIVRRHLRRAVAALARLEGAPIPNVLGHHRGQILVHHLQSPIRESGQSTPGIGRIDPPLDQTDRPERAQVPQAR